MVSSHSQQSFSISFFHVNLDLGMAECRIPFSGHCDLDLVFRIIISPILFEVLILKDH